MRAPNIRFLSLLSLLGLTVLSSRSYGGTAAVWPPDASHIKRIAIYKCCPEGENAESLDWSKLKFTIDDGSTISQLVDPLKSAPVENMKGQGIMRRGNAFLEFDDGSRMTLRFYSDWTLVAELGKAEATLEIPQSCADLWIKCAIVAEK